MQNKLYYGDNYEVLQRYIAASSVDLIYLDPPFNSRQDYNVLFAEKDGTKSSSQFRAFEDTWEWNVDAERSYQHVVETVGGRIADAMRAFRTFLGNTDMMAYLAMMAPRLVELKRVLKPTGSIYLHCDPTASHYLKILMDAVFGGHNFGNEITWKRTFAHGNVSRNFGSVSDVLLWYRQGADYRWNQPYKTLSATEIEKKYPEIDAEGRRWQSVTLRNPGVRPNLHYPYLASNGITYKRHPNGWSCNIQRMRKYDAERRLHYPKVETGALRLKMYADESPGEKLQNIWEDIPPISALARERLG
jgi:site-specific DNA-methyltransferase (adenine-specific)